MNVGLTDKKGEELRITVVKKELDAARRSGDQLRADLLEDTLNDLLDKYRCNT